MPQSSRISCKRGWLEAVSARFGHEIKPEASSMGLGGPFGASHGAALPSRWRLLAGSSLGELRGGAESEAGTGEALKVKLAAARRACWRCRKGLEGHVTRRR